MLQNHIEQKLLENLQYEPTKSQVECIQGISDFFVCNKNHATFLLKGYAGTGKTTLVNAIVKTFREFKIKTELMAPTGRAAKVLSSYTKKQAFTIHKKIYRQNYSGDGMGDFSLDFNKATDTVFIVDEASMISDSPNERSLFGSGRLLSDLIRYVFNGARCKLILIGDVAQLPPVGLELSPALHRKELEMRGLYVFDAFLRDIVRQSSDSGILFNATKIRNIIDEEKVEIPSFETEAFEDIELVSGADLIEKIGESYDKFGTDDTIIITRSNKRANKFNQGIRNQIMWRENELEIGDLLMVVKNNYFWLDEKHQASFIANGDIIRILRIHKVYEEYGFRFADLTVEFLDYENIEVEVKVILETLYSESPALTNDQQNKLYQTVLEDYADLPTKKARFEKMRKDEHFNALQVKFAYALTCHKSQGGQWSAAFLDQGYFTEDMISIEYLRWMYTGFTRSVKKLYLVNFHKQFIDISGK